MSWKDFKKIIIDSRDENLVLEILVAFVFDAQKLH